MDGDAIRSHAPGFIFTTSIPPALGGGGGLDPLVRAHDGGRRAHQERAATLRRKLRAVGLPISDSDSLIVPLMVGDPVHRKAILDMLVEHHGIYVRPINYPTVPRETERLGFTPSPAHADAMMDAWSGL